MRRAVSNSKESAKNAVTAIADVKYTTRRIFYNNKPLINTNPNLVWIILN